MYRKKKKGEKLPEHEEKETRCKGRRRKEKNY